MLEGELHATVGLDLLFEHEWRFRQERATSTRKIRSKIRKDAALEEFDLTLKRGKTALFMSVTDFLEHQSIARTCNGYLKFRAGLVRPDVLILDDLGTRKFTAQEAEDLRDVIEHRSYGKSTIITTQLPTDPWSEVMGGRSSAMH